MARCPNCARTVRFWHNYSGYCSKQCRTDSITSCPNCGKVGLFKHARLGCCSEDCRNWYVANLLGYDKEALLTPAWDKVVYHVRLPSNSAEISSLQLDELEYDRAIDTVLVIAAPPWMTRPVVLAELPYERFDNMAWQHLWADGTLTEEELFRFHRACYEDDLLCQKLGQHVFAKLRQPPSTYSGATPAPLYSGATPPAGYLESPALPILSAEHPAAVPQARLTAAGPPPAEFVASVRAIFEHRGYTVAAGAAENTLLLQRQGRTALAAYHHHSGLIDIDPVQRAYAAGMAAGAARVFVVTNGRFTLQAEDFAAAHPVQLIDGDEMAALAAQRHEMPTISAQPELTPPLNLRVVDAAMAPNGDNGAERTEIEPAIEPKSATANISLAGKMAPVDAEIVGGETVG